MEINKSNNVIGMYKYNSKVIIEDKEKTIKQLRNFKKGIKRSQLTGFYYMSFVSDINGLFKDVKQDYIEYKSNERLMSVIIEILLVLDFLGVEFDYEITISNLICYSDKLSFLANTENMPNICKLAA